MARSASSAPSSSRTKLSSGLATKSASARCLMLHRQVTQEAFAWRLVCPAADQHSIKRSKGRGTNDPAGHGASECESKLPVKMPELYSSSQRNKGSPPPCERAIHDSTDAPGGILPRMVFREGSAGSTRRPLQVQGRRASFHSARVFLRGSSLFPFAHLIDNHRVPYLAIRAGRDGPRAADAFTIGEAVLTPEEFETYGSSGDGTTLPWSATTRKRTRTKPTRRGESMLRVLALQQNKQENQSVTAGKNKHN